MTNEAAQRIAALAIAWRLARVRAWQATRDSTREAHLAAREEARSATDALDDALLALTLEELQADPVPLQADEKLEGVLADLRRLYLHIAAGGQVERHDSVRVGRAIAALERAQVRFHDLEAEVKA